MPTDSQKARRLVRSYPFKAGQSELKKFYSRFFDKDESIVISTVEGLKLHLDNYKDNVRLFWWFEEVEAALQFYVRHFLPVGGRMLDVGASSGVIGLLAARLKGAQVKLVEANLKGVATLKKTLELNPELAPLIQLYGQPCALGPVDSRFSNQAGITIEKIIQDAGWDHVDLLKVDVDGPDFDVLRSAGAFLRRDFIHSIFIETEIADPGEIRKIAALGYIPYGTRKTHLAELRKLGINQTERTHFSSVDLAGLTKKNLPANILFVSEISPLNEHLRRWLA